MKRTTVAVWHEKYQRWQINVQKDGVRRSFYSSTSGRAGQRECHKKADTWLDEGIENENAKIKVLFDKYANELKETASKTNYIKTKSIGDNWIVPNLGNIKISKLNEQHLQNVINKAFKKDLKRKSLQNIRAIMLSFLKYCRKSKATTLHPEHVTIPKGATSLEKKILQPQDLVKLFTSDKTIYRDKEIKDWYINAYRFQVLTGLRPGELMALKWSDIIGNVVSIKNSKNYLNEITKGKNDNAVRRFVLNSLAKNVLDEQEKDRESAFVFGDMNLSTYSKRWSIYCEYNNIDHVSLYELRHTFVSIAKGLSEGEIRPIIGHSKNMDTFGTYSHELKGDLTNTAFKLESLFSNILEPKKNECVN